LRRVEIAVTALQESWLSGLSARPPPHVCPRRRGDAGRASGEDWRWTSEAQMGTRGLPASDTAAACSARTRAEWAAAGTLLRVRLSEIV
jgi:hypothetical protein